VSGEGTDFGDALKAMVNHRDRNREIGKQMSADRAYQSRRSAEICTCVKLHGGFTKMGNHWTDCKSSTKG
jgi:hypothetical protein